MINTELYENIPKDPFSFRISKYEHTGYRFRQHWHEHTELHIILEGSCQLECNGEQITLTKGDCAVINSGELHRGGGGDCLFLCLLLSPSFFGNTCVIFERYIRDPHLFSFLTSLTPVADGEELSVLLEQRGTLHLLMAHLVRHYALRELKGSIYTRHIAKLEKINRAITYIHEHYEKPLTTRKLAETLYMSEGYFCQLFKEVMKQSATEYVNGVRAEKAKHLLTSTSLDISEIAFRCGFSDANYFSRVYKKIYRETPTQTRNKG